jgi:hypothetical protein
MKRYPTGAPVRAACCDDCGSQARTIQLRRGGRVCGRCLVDRRKATARCFMSREDADPVVGQMKLTD